MSLNITDACINCGACDFVCPNKAIYAGATPWNFSGGTALKGVVKHWKTAQKINTQTPQTPLQDDIFYIAPEKCTHCVGFDETPACAEICPIDCIEEAHEPRERLMEKFKWLHQR